MLGRILRLSPLAMALPLVWALPAAALEFGSPCTGGDRAACEIATMPPAMELHPGEGKDSVTFENGHDARPPESLVSSEEPGGPSLETPSEPPSGDGEMNGDGEHPIIREPGDHRPIEGEPGAVGDELGDPVGGSPAAVPEPVGLLLMAVSAGGLLLARRRA
jgi:hypothetical protein